MHRKAGWTLTHLKRQTVAHIIICWCCASHMTAPLKISNKPLSFVIFLWLLRFNKTLFRYCHTHTHLRDKSQYHIGWEGGGGEVPGGEGGGVAAESTEQDLPLLVLPHKKVVIDRGADSICSDLDQGGFICSPPRYRRKLAIAKIVGVVAHHLLQLLQPPPLPPCLPSCFHCHCRRPSARSNYPQSTSSSSTRCLPLPGLPLHPPIKLFAVHLLLILLLFDKMLAVARVARVAIASSHLLWLCFLSLVLRSSVLEPHFHLQRFEFIV